MDFSKRVIGFCEEENYFREGPVDDVEFSAVAHKLYGIFFTRDLDIDRMVEVSNCTIYARIRTDKE